MRRTRWLAAIVVACSIGAKASHAEGPQPRFWCNWIETESCKRAKEARDEIERERVEAERRRRIFADSEKAFDERELLVEPKEIQRYFTTAPGGPKTEVAVLYASGNKAVVVVHGQYEPREVQLCREVARGDAASGRCTQVRKALFDAKDLYRGPSATQVRITLVGHADIQRLATRNVTLSDDVKAECSARKLAAQSNDCIALARAFDFRPLVATKLFDGENRTVIRVSFDVDPFMANTNGALRGSLYKQLELTDSVAELRSVLGIGSGWTPERMRADEEVQRRLLSMEGLTAKLAPFRSVVVIFEPCKGMAC